jgi:hypothetical protein
MSNVIVKTSADTIGYTLSRGEDIYDVLLAEFGDLAADTIVSVSCLRSMTSALTLSRSTHISSAWVSTRPQTIPAWTLTV